MEIFGKELELRKKGCWCNGEYRGDYERPFVNLFIQVSKACNARCPFCVYRSDSQKGFDVKKLDYVLRRLNSEIRVNKLNLTGGEPMLDLPLFDEVMSAISGVRFNEKPEVTLNTNGLCLYDAFKWLDVLDFIALSRHHYKDSVNEEIFGTGTVPKADQIRFFVSVLSGLGLTHKIQLRCNLMSPGIHDFEGIKSYLDHVIFLGAHDCGFVTLQPVNAFCDANQVSFMDLIEPSKSIIRLSGWERKENGEYYCGCGNYCYTDERGSLCKFYARHFCNVSNNDSVLVYDGSHLRQGFDGEILY